MRGQWAVLISLLFGQLTVLLVVLILAWTSAKGRRESRETLAESEARLKELHARVELRKKGSNGQ